MHLMSACSGLRPHVNLMEGFTQYIVLCSYGLHLQGFYPLKKNQLQNNYKHHIPRFRKHSELKTNNSKILNLHFEIITCFLLVLQ